MPVILIRFLNTTNSSSCFVMRAPARYTGSPLLLRGEAIRKERPGGSEDVREAISHVNPCRYAFA